MTTTTRYPKSSFLSVAINGGGHTWSGTTPAMLGLGKSTMDVSANDLMWKFFQRHPMKQVRVGTDDVDGLAGFLRTKILAPPSIREVPASFERPITTRQLKSKHLLSVSLSRLMEARK